MKVNPVPHDLRVRGQGGDRAADELRRLGVTQRRGRSALLRGVGPAPHDAAILRTARWCHETLIAVTKDGLEARFFEAWALGADFLQARGIYTGEGGVIGLAAALAGWGVDYQAVTRTGAAVRHEGGGPKGRDWLSRLTRRSSAIAWLTRALLRAAARRRLSRPRAI
jgi:hypothetical protein